MWDAIHCELFTLVFLYSIYELNKFLLRTTRRWLSRNGIIGIICCERKRMKWQPSTLFLCFVRFRSQHISCDEVGKRPGFSDRSMESATSAVRAFATFHFRHRAVSFTLAQFLPVSVDLCDADKRVAFETFYFTTKILLIFTG